MFETSPETLIGQVIAAFGITFQSGPVRLDFTNRRFIVTSNSSPSLPPAIGLYRTWKATLPLGPYCRIVGVPYLQDLAQVWAEIPNEQMAGIGPRRAVGLGVDKTMSLLWVTNVRQGWQLGPGAAAKPGLPPKSSGAMDLLFRVPSTPEEIHAFLLQTPVASVVRAP
jgi:hypothetical protein